MKCHIKHLKTALVALVHAITIIWEALGLSFKKNTKSIIQTFHISCVLYPEVCLRNKKNKNSHELQQETSNSLHLYSMDDLKFEGVNNLHFV